MKKATLKMPVQSQQLPKQNRSWANFDSLPEGIQIHDFDWKYMYVNDALVKLSSYTKAQLIGKTIMAMYPNIEQTDMFKVMKRCMDKRVTERIVTDFISPNGVFGSYELSIVPVPEGLLILSVDRTAQQKVNEKLLKIKDLYAFISQINQDVLRLSEENTLYKNSCKIAVKFGKFAMAWVGLFDSDYKTISMVEHCGLPKENLHMVTNLTIHENGPQDRALKATSLYICNDIQNESDLLKWAPFAKAYGIHSAIVLPFRKAGKIIGTLNLYSEKFEFSDKDEIDLLIEVATDISFALDLFEKAKQHKETEKLLLQNERRFRALIEKSPDMQSLTTEAGQIVYGSPSITKVLGYPLEEYLDIAVSDFIHPDDIAHYVAQRNKIKSTPGKSFLFEFRLHHKNGDWIWCEGTITNMLHISGVNAFVANFRNASEKKAAAEQRQYDQNNLNALINNTNDLMWSLDTDFRLITFNEPFKAMVKYMYDHTLKKGDNVFKGSSPQQSKKYKALYERAFAGEIFAETEYTELPVEYWSEISFYPIRIDNVVIGTACHSRNITEIKMTERLLKKSEAFSNNVINSLNAHIAVIDKSGAIVAVNEAWSSFALENGETTLQRTGINSNYFHVCAVSDKAGDETAAIVLKGLKKVMEKQDTAFYYEYPCHSSTEERWFAMLAMPFEGEEELIVVSHQDISKRKLAEERLISNIDELKKTNFELDRFVYSVSHDLRAPLTSVLGLLSFIEEETEETSTLNHAAMIRNSINRLDEYIKNILYYSRNNRTELKIEKIELQKKVEEIVKSLMHTKQAEHISFEVDIEATAPFYSDKQSLNTVIENLISNAIKFQDRTKGKQTIKISAVTTQNDLTLIVSDNGIGIATENHTKIFDMFFRLSGEIAGSGIGLYIVKEIVEKLDGSIKVDSEIGKQTSFTMQFKNLNP